MYGEDLTRMASKNHDQYLFCELRFWGDAFAPLGECWSLGGVLGAIAPCMHMHHTKWDSHAPTINTADSPRRHQCVYQLIKLGLSTVVQSAYSMPAPLVWPLPSPPERHRLDI
jgi:hypothetical protein